MGPKGANWQIEIYDYNLVFGESTSNGEIGIDPQTGTITGLDFTHTETIDCSDTISTGSGMSYYEWEKKCVDEESMVTCVSSGMDNCTDGCDDFTCDMATCDIKETDNPPFILYKTCVDKSIEVPDVTVDYFSIN